MPLSTNSLFHFTEKEYLLSILESDFYPRYCTEIFEDDENGRSQIAFPMTCFCDIPLSQIGEHIGKYGHYGIGLSKEWAIRNGLNPLFYVDKSSTVFRTIYDLLKNNLKSVKALPIRQLICDRASLIYLHSFLKPYELGIDLTNGTHVNRFYDEREWRYVPKIERLDGDELQIGEDVKEKVNLDKKNELLKQYPLSFTPDDIRYIVIEKESMRLSFIKSIKEKKIEKYGEDSVNILVSKIISTEQIMSDL